MHCILMIRLILSICLYFPGQSHLILETGSTSHTRTSRFTNLSCADVLYRPLENLDAIALLYFLPDKGKSVTIAHVQKIQE
jgi:hypothetical protein